MEQISTRTVYENRWMKVREDHVGRGDGSRGVFGVVEKPSRGMTTQKLLLLDRPQPR